MDSSGYPRVCCTFSSSCGTTTGKAVSYFRSPDWPNPTHNHSDCSMEFTVSPGVCQVTPAMFINTIFRMRFQYCFTKSGYMF